MSPNEDRSVQALSAQAVHLRKCQVLGLVKEEGLEGRQAAQTLATTLSLVAWDTFDLSMIQMPWAQTQKQNGIPGELRTPRTSLSTQWVLCK